MKTSKIYAVLAALILAIALAGCATPEARIQKNPEIFARLTSTQQDMIKKGQVGVGFDQEMVRLALGDADRVLSRTDAKGTSEVWSYVTYDGGDGYPYPIYRGYYHRYYGWGDPLYPYYMNYSARRTREQLKVTFGPDGKVASIEQEKR
jgi:outer membrane protein assembly factor BamE (lipoprotein component of BamABCDE complex)